MKLFFYDSGVRYDAPFTNQTKKGIRMAGNPVPKTQDELLALAEDISSTRPVNVESQGETVAQNFKLHPTSTGPV
jgi:hypothetical protein